MVDSVRSPGTTSSATVPLNTQASCVRHVCGASTTLVLMVCTVWIFRTVMSVSNPLAVVISLETSLSRQGESRQVRSSLFV